LWIGVAHVVRSSRVFLAFVGDEGSRDGQFIAPAGVAVGRDRHVFVADSGNDRIVEFNFSGHFVRSFGTVFSVSKPAAVAAAIAAARSADR
jgi:DNA-binding beta-propeller fold protein YncE